MLSLHFKPKEHVEVCHTCFLSDDFVTLIADLKRKLLSSPIRLSKQLPEMPKARRDSIADYRAADLKLARSNLPDNPATPAFWIAEGRYRHHLFAQREVDKQKRMLSSQTTATSRLKSDETHPSKIYFVDVYGSRGAVHKAHHKTTSEPPKHEQIEEPKPEKGEKEETKPVDKLVAERPPPGKRLDAMKGLTMKEPVPPQQPRRIYRYHHIT